MAELMQARVPDIGDDKDVPVIELLVKPGDTVRKDQGLVTLESDKATMEVPSPFDGIVRELKVKIGDALSEGSVVAMIEPTESGSRVTEWTEDLRPESVLEMSSQMSGVTDRPARNRTTMSGTLERLAAAVED